MRRNRIPSVVGTFVLVTTAVASASASVGGDPPPETRPPSTDVRTEEPRATARQDAERDYGSAYREIARAKEETAKGKPKQAEKRFQKALDRASSAVSLDSSYFEAWNLLGYAARNLRDYDRSIAAYSRCLAINPDYAPAREYLAEAYVDLKQASKAREQLAWLEKFGSRETIASLRGKIEAIETTTAAGQGAPADSVSTVKAESAP